MVLLTERLGTKAVGGFFRQGSLAGRAAGTRPDKRAPIDAGAGKNEFSTKETYENRLLELPSELCSRPSFRIRQRCITP